MRDFLNIMKDTNRYEDSHWNRTNYIYTFASGSYIEFFSADNPDKLRGSRRNYLFINECSNVSYDAYLQLSMRTDESIYLDYNPSHKFWVDDISDDDSDKIILTYRDNEALSDSIINFLESKRNLAKTNDYWKEWCKVYLDGKEGRLEGCVFNDYEVIYNIPDDARLEAIGLDFGYSVDVTAMVAVYKYNNEIILDELIYETGLTNPQIARRFKQCNLRAPIYADSAEPKSIKEIRNFGIKILPTKKGRDSINYGIQLLQERKINITKGSINLIEEFNKYKWKKDKNGNTLNVPIDDYNHGIDAVRYVALTKIGKKKSGPLFTTGST